MTRAIASNMSEEKLFSFYRLFVRETFFPLLLIVATVTSAVTLPYIVTYGNAHNLLSSVKASHGVTNLVSHAWSAVNWTDVEVWTIIAVAGVWATVSLLLPGDTYYGPVTVTGFRPMYKKSGFLFYILSMAVTCPLLWYTSVLHLYPKFVTFAAILSVMGLVFSAFLFIKGHVSPSPGLFGSSGNALFDFYWGLELYPRLVKNIFDLKTIINCRFGLWLWQAVVLWSWKANYELNATSDSQGAGVNLAITASTILQTLYLAKFYYWEDGYMSTIDISVDKFGFYVGWGCIAWVPTFYTLTSVYLIKHAPSNAVFTMNAFIATVTLGVLSIWLNYESDRQRQVFRLNRGKCTIWGFRPKIVHAVYSTEDGEMKQSQLLASGLWGQARHLNYLFELLAALSWSLPGLLTSLVPYMYFIFLTILLVHRSIRDDDKCQSKYGKYWDKYCEIVKYRIVPFIY